MVSVAIAEEKQTLASYIASLPFFSHCQIEPYAKNTTCTLCLSLPPATVTPEGPLALIVCGDEVLSGLESWGRLVITYGISPLCTITASSIEEGRGLYFICCIQRSLLTLKGQIIEPQEFPVFFPGSLSITEGLALAALGLMTDKSPDSFKNIHGKSM